MFKSQAIRYLATLLAVGCLGQTPLLSAQVFPSVSIPSELQGRYSLDVTAATPLSPLQPANPRVVPYDIQLYVTAIGDMCIKRSNSETVDLIASSPELRGGPFGKVHWDIPSLDLVFALDINNIAFSGFDVLSTAGS